MDDIFNKLCSDLDISIKIVGNIKHPIYPHITAHIDGIQNDGKIVYVKKVDNLQYNNIQLSKNDHKKIQKQLHCIGSHICNIVYWCDGKYIIIELERDNTIDYGKRDWSEWVSASKVRNYLMKDPLLDWLNLYGDKYRDSNDDKNKMGKEDGFLSFILNKGNQFEKQVVEELRKKHGKKFKEISKSYQARDRTKYEDTIKAMKEGVPIIYQGILHNEKNQTYGAPDLIVRTDYLHHFGTHYIDENKEKGKSIISYDYRIVDIKCSTLNLTADGYHLLNCNSAYAFKGQLYIYTKALENILGYMPSCAYILGRRWKYVSKGKKYMGYDWNKRLGTINYADFDNQYVGLTEKAIEWIKKVRVEGSEWKIIKDNGCPSVPELYPNMSNHHDGKWHKVKKDIANEIKEVTLLWQCGKKNREIAHKNGIYRWDDKKCCAKKLGIKGKRKAPILDSIIRVNKNKKRKIMYDKKVVFKSTMKLYVDFETISNICTDFKSPMIFMIGVGYFGENSGKWVFRSFIAKDMSFRSEKKILNDFYNYVNKLSPNRRRKTLYHWGHVEESLFRTARERHMGNKWDNLEWHDLLKTFKDNKIVLKGCLNFGLKNVAKAMYDNGFIKTTWSDDNKCSDGKNAMIMAYREYAKGMGIEGDIMRDIEKYNEIDCKVLWEIVVFLEKMM